MKETLGARLAYGRPREELDALHPEQPPAAPAPQSSEDERISIAAKYQVMPALAVDEYEALKREIAAHGVKVAVEMDGEGNILDGHHRVKICQELGIAEYPIKRRLDLPDDAAKRRYAHMLNLSRRHLTAEQKRHLIGQQLSDTPEASDRQIASALQVDHKTVAAQRTRSEASGEIPQPTKRVGADGRARSARPALQRMPAPEPQPIKPAESCASPKHGESIPIIKPLDVFGAIKRILDPIIPGDIACESKALETGFEYRIFAKDMPVVDLTVKLGPLAEQSEPTAFIDAAHRLRTLLEQWGGTQPRAHATDELAAGDAHHAEIPCAWFSQAASWPPHRRNLLWAAVREGRAGINTRQYRRHGTPTAAKWLAAHGLMVIKEADRNAFYVATEKGRRFVEKTREYDRQHVPLEKRPDLYRAQIEKAEEGNAVLSPPAVDPEIGYALDVSPLLRPLGDLLAACRQRSPAAWSGALAKAPETREQIQALAAMLLPWMMAFAGAASSPLPALPHADPDLNVH